MLKLPANGSRSPRTRTRSRSRSRSRPQTLHGTSLLHDKQSEPDHRELRIDKVGVRGLRFPIQIRDKARSLQNTVATIGLFVDLPKEIGRAHV